jgi:hypothetical protein
MSKLDNLQATDLEELLVFHEMTSMPRHPSVKKGKISRRITRK